MDEVAELFNKSCGPGAEVWDANKARRILLRSGAAFKLGGRFVTTISALQEAFPTVWHNLLMAMADRDEDEDDLGEVEDKKKPGAVVNGGRR
jgi:hypothetical protein